MQEVSGSIPTGDLYFSVIFLGDVQKNKQLFSNGNKFIKIEAQFIDEISELAIVKMLDSREQCTVVWKLMFIGN